MSFAMPTTLETERLKLRQFDLNDLDSLTAMFADEEFVRYTIGQPQTAWESWRWLSTYVGHWQLRGYGPYAVIEKSTNLLIGPIGIWYPGEWPGPEMMWSISRKFWGNGYATEAALALKKAARTAGFQRIISMIHPDNDKSKAVAKRLGATYESTVPFLGGTAEVYVHSR